MYHLKLKFEVIHIFSLNIFSFISLADIHFYGKNGWRIGLGKSKNLWPLTQDSHLEIMINFYVPFFTFLIKSIWCGWENYFLLLSLAHHLNKSLRKWHSTRENRQGYFLFSPHVWPPGLLFTSQHPSKFPCFFLSNTENNPDASTFYIQVHNWYQQSIHRMCHK